jgi:hypothetical protein
MLFTVVAVQALVEQMLAVLMVLLVLVVEAVLLVQELMV